MMTSAANPPNPPHVHPPTTATHATTVQPPTPTSQASPPSKRDLKSWWKNFKLSSRHEEAHETKPQGIFGVPLRQSIVYANVAISLVDDYGKSYIYGYVPIVVAKCGVFLKEKATGVEGIFRLNGSEKRIKELKLIFDSPDRYGKGLSWDGYTVHDAANVLRRYLNDLPEPVVPLDLYERFRDPLRGATRSAVGDAEGPHFIDDFDVDGAIVKYQQLIKELPPLNRQLLLYILDLLAVFAAKADENRMNSQNLAAIFQPGMLSHPVHAMAPEEYRLNQCVIIFLIENQDHFLIGMQGTAADEKTVQEVQKGTPVINAPVTPNSSRKSGVHRSASNASAGAESVSREGKIRRNKSTSSRRSRASNGAPSPGSPAVTTPTSGGLGRSNTVPSKRSPALQHGRFAHMRNEGLPVSPLTPVVATSANNIPAPPTVEEVATPEPREYPDPMLRTAGGLTPAHAAQRSQERLLEPKPAADSVTPSKDRNISSLFQRSPTDGAEKKPPNKLRKKRIPSTNPSAASSTASLPHSTAVSPNTESPNPMERIGESPRKEAEEALQELKQESTETPSEPTPRASQMPSTGTLPTQNAERSLRAQKSPPDSLHSSFNDGSEIDRVDEALASSEQAESAEQQDREKKRRWRLSRKKEDSDASEPSVTSPRRIGFNRTADMSTSSVGTEGYKPRRSLTNDSSDPNLDMHSSYDSGRDGRDDHKGFSGWIKNKMREAKENAEHKRTKSPPGDHGSISGILPMRGKSLDLKRPTEAEKDAPKAQEPGPSQH